MRSGQNTTSTSRPAARSRRSTVSVVPGKTVERSTIKAAVPQVRHEVVEHLVEDAHRRVHELVDRRADDEDHRVGALEQAGSAAELEPAGGQELAEQLVGAVLEERHVARLDDLLDLGCVDVVDADPVAAVGKRQGERQADVAAAADDDDVKGVHGGQIMMARLVAPSPP